VSENQERSFDAVRDRLRKHVIDHAFRFTIYGGAGAWLLGLHTAYSQRAFGMIAIYVLAYAGMLGLYFGRKPYYQIKKWSILSLIYVLGLSDLIFSGWGADGRIFLLALPVMVTILIGQRAGYYTLGFVGLTLLMVSWAVIGGRVTGLPIHSIAERPWLNLLSNMMVFLLIDGLLVTSAGTLFRRLSQQLEDVFQRSNSLREQQEDLDRRAIALQKANYAMQRRAWHLEAGADVVRVISSIFDVDQLVYRAVRLISEKFGFYHTGLFLVTSSSDVAVLKAASSEGGQQMLAKGHQLRRGEGMVGWVVEHAEPRISLDVGEDAVHFDNPFLPATRSEAALPLQIADRVIGVLDVQSTEANAFDDDDLRSFAYLADQLAVTVENARRFAQEIGVLEATSPFYRMTQRMAAAHQESQVYGVILEMVRDYSPSRGFVCTLDADRTGLTVVAELRSDEVSFPEDADAQPTLPKTPYLREILQTLEEPLFVQDISDLAAGSVPEIYHESLMQLLEQSAVRSLAIVPILLGGRVMAQLVIVYYTVHPFGVSERQLYTALVDTAAVVLENIRLLEAAQRRVARERATRDVTDRMRQAPDMNTLLQITAESLLDTLGGGGAYVQLGVPTASEGTADEGAQ
jgi:GAF domain-containing protein